VATVLVVDDNAINRKLLVALLSGDGHLTIEATDGADGLEAARSHHPQLIISDILMPTMDGYAFVAALRQDAELRSTPVIFHTANYHEREAQTLARACGVSCVLVKPCPPAALLKAVEQVLCGVTETNAQLPDNFDREHVRLLTDKLSQRAEELAASNARFAALADLNLEITREPDANAILERVCHGARHLLGSTFAVLGLADDSEPLGVFFATSGISAESLALEPADLHSGALGQILSLRKPWRVRLEAQDGGCALPASFPRANAYLGVPLKSPSRVYGWLCLGDKVGAAGFSGADERLLLTLGALVSVAYENIRLQRELHRQGERLSRTHALLGGVSALVAEAQERDVVCQEACRLMVDRAHYRMAFVELARAAQRHVEFVAGVGEDSDLDTIARRGAKNAGADELVEIALNTELPAVCNDLRDTQLRIRNRADLLARGFRAIAVLPLNGCLSGRLVLLADEAGIFDEAERRLLIEFGNGVALALAQVGERLVAAAI
jgi:CheY-like chemotaxis protein/GAF domain-containing protein